MKLSDNLDDYYLSFTGISGEHRTSFREDNALARLMVDGACDFHFGTKTPDGDSLRVTVGGVDIAGDEVLKEMLAAHLDGTLSSYLIEHGSKTPLNLRSLRYYKDADLDDFYYEGKFDLQAALFYLLHNDHIDACIYDSYVGNNTEDCTTLSVNANDVFAWAMSIDHNLLNENEIETLMQFVFDGRPYSIIRWLCVTENEKPQYPWIERMKEEGQWDEVMEQLPGNYSDTMRFWMLCGIPELALP